MYIVCLISEDTDAVRVSNQVFNYLVEGNAVTNDSLERKSVFAHLGVRQSRFERSKPPAPKLAVCVCSETDSPHYDAVVPRSFFPDLSKKLYACFIEPGDYTVLSLLTIHCSSKDYYVELQENPQALVNILLAKRAINAKDSLGPWLRVANALPKNFGVFSVESTCRLELVDQPSSSSESTKDLVNGARSLATYKQSTCYVAPVAARCSICWFPQPYLYQKDKALNSTVIKYLDTLVKSWMWQRAGRIGQFVAHRDEVHTLKVSERAFSLVYRFKGTSQDLGKLFNFLSAASFKGRSLTFQFKFSALFAKDQCETLRLARVCPGQTTIDYVADGAAIKGQLCPEPQLSQQIGLLAFDFTLFPSFSEQSANGRTYKRLERMVLAAHCNSPPERFRILIHGPAQSGKSVLVQQVARRLKLHILELEAADSVHSLVPANPEQWLASKASRLDQNSLLLIRHIDVLENDDQVASWWSRGLEGLPVIAVATATDRNRLSTSLLAQFEVVLEWRGPEPNSINEFLCQQIAAEDLPLPLAQLTKELAPFSWPSIWRVARAAPKNMLEVIDREKRQLAENLGAPKVPLIKWSDVGGLQELKKIVSETVDNLNDPGAIGRRHGLLFYGPPGTGKTLVAKAIACEMGYFFLSVKGPELLNMYIGESEANVRRIFERARSSLPCVIFFDEIDSVAPSRGNAGDSRGVMDRLVSQLLAEMDSMEPGLLVIAATNRPDLIDEALLRPGRFDKMVYLGVPASHEAQLDILRAQTRKLSLAPECNLSEIAKKLPLNLTGADIYALCSGAQTAAVRRLVEAHSFECKLVLQREDFIQALKRVKASVSLDELEDYRRLQSKYST